MSFRCQDRRQVLLTLGWDWLPTSRDSLGMKKWDKNVESSRLEHFFEIFPLSQFRSTVKIRFPKLSLSVTQVSKFITISYPESLPKKGETSHNGWRDTISHGARMGVGRVGLGDAVGRKGPDLNKRDLPNACGILPIYHIFLTNQNYPNMT